MGTESPFITIGIASYNYARYLPEAFEMIRKQNFRDFEVLYCDDGSKDESVEVIQGFIRDNPDMRIRLIQGENGGILANKNRIVQNAQGRYLMICDADDYMAPNCLELLCSAAQREDADCVIGAFQEVDNDGNILKNHALPRNPSKWLYSQHHGQIYKIRLIREHDIAFTELPDDVPYLQTMHAYCQNVAFVNTPVYFWRQHSTSVSRDISTHKDWSPVPIWNKLVSQMQTVRKLAPHPEDASAINYYLYKYYYINSFAVQVRNDKEAKAQLKEIQSEMKKHMPNYRKFGHFCKACGTGDTLFSKTAVMVSWILEKVGLLHLVMRARLCLQKK